MPWCCRYRRARREFQRLEYCADGGPQLLGDVVGNRRAGRRGETSAPARRPFARVEFEVARLQDDAPVEIEEPAMDVSGERGIAAFGA